MNTLRNLTSLASLTLTLFLPLPVKAAHQADPGKIPRSVGELLTFMDKDHDRRVSLAEHEAGAMRMFQIMDTDQDGHVTAAECDAAAAVGRGHGAVQSMSGARKIAVLDTDGDGRLSRQEDIDGAKRLFGEMDLNRDGRLTQAELKTAFARKDWKLPH